MSKTWPKEDRGLWDNSEVMKAFEQKILSNYSLVEKIAQKMNLPEVAKKLPEVTKGLNEASVAASNLSKTLSGSADDGAIDESCAACSLSEADDEYSDEKTAIAKKEILLDLQKMANHAINAGKIKLAYMIERTIAEIGDN